MRPARLFAAVVAHLLLLVVGGAAHASPVTVIFCASYQVAYTGNTAHDDYFTSNANQPARGAKITVTQNGGSVISNAYSAWTGSPGCTAGLTLDTTATYTVKILSRAMIDTNEVQVTDATGAAFFSSTALTAYQPPAGGAIKTITTGVHAAWNVAAASGWALFHDAGGVQNATWRFRTGTGVSTNQFVENGGAQYSNVFNDADKYRIVHEMGHQLMHLGNGGTLGTNGEDYGAAADGCPSIYGGHDLNSKEYQAAAVKEGFASFYAQITFNDGGINADCYYHHFGDDWNLDNRTNDSTDPSCDLGPYPYPGATTPIDAYDYLGDFCLATGEVNNRGTQYDYMRFFWDLHTKNAVGSPLSLSQIVDVIDTSNPESWSLTGAGTGGTYPANMLRAAAIVEGVYGQWDNQDDLNGVHR